MACIAFARSATVKALNAANATATKAAQRNANSAARCACPNGMWITASESAIGKTSNAVGTSTRRHSNAATKKNADNQGLFTPKMRIHALAAKERVVKGFIGMRRVFAWVGT